MTAWVQWVNGLTNPSHTSEWISGIAGAGGAILGSIVAIIATEFISWRKRKRDQREKLSAAAFTALQRLNQIYSVTITLRDHLKEGKSLSDKQPIQLCLATRPIQRMSSPVIFPAEEMWAMIKIGGGKLLNNIQSLDNVFNMLLDTMDSYNRDRQELTDAIPAPEIMSGHRGTSAVSEQDIIRLRPKIIDLNGRIISCISIADKLAVDAFSSLVLIATSEKRLFGKKFEIQLPNPAGEIVKFGARIKSPVPGVRDHGDGAFNIPTSN